jgi:hypothetical protein
MFLILTFIASCDFRSCKIKLLIFNVNREKATEFDESWDIPSIEKRAIVILLMN